jgi:lipooligosaccharide transport system ATP-binding protein
MTASPTAPPVEARALVKRYGDLVAVDGIDLDVPAGRCVGLLGPNGAGKTTTVRMLTCFTPITGGSARVFGLDVATRPREVKALLGVCPQEDNLDPDFTTRKNLTVFARYYDIPAREARRRADELLELLALTDKADVKIDALSGGMKRRLVLARALLNRPRLLVLDEPTTGLDPQARQALWQRIRRLRSEGTTVLLTTHYMEEAAQLCDEVLLFDHGRILLAGAPHGLIQTEVGREVIELWNVAPEVRAFLDDAGHHVEEVGERLVVVDREGGTIGVALGARFPHQERLIRHATLEDVFLRHTGRTLRD